MVKERDRTNEYYRDQGIGVLLIIVILIVSAASVFMNPNITDYEKKKVILDEMRIVFNSVPPINTEEYNISLEDTRILMTNLYNIDKYSGYQNEAEMFRILIKSSAPKEYYVDILKYFDETNIGEIELGMFAPLLVKEDENIRAEIKRIFLLGTESKRINGCLLASDKTEFLNMYNFLKNEKLVDMKNLYESESDFSKFIELYLEGDFSKEDYKFYIDTVGEEVVKKQILEEGRAVYSRFFKDYDCDYKAKVDDLGIKFNEVEEEKYQIICELIEMNRESDGSNNGEALDKELEKLKRLDELDKLEE